MSSLTPASTGGTAQPPSPASSTAAPGSAALPANPTVTSATPASPPVTADAYENICGICFTDIHPVDNPRGRLNSCNHLFCSYCIKEWAKNTNVCPSCKARFTRIYTFHADRQKEEETKVRKRNYVAWETTYYDDDEEEEEFEQLPGDGNADTPSRSRSSDLSEQVMCDVCQQSHNAARMIFCDRRQCPYAAHLDCLGLAERPVTFLCPSCTVLREQEGGMHRPLADTFTASTATRVTSPPSATKTAAAAAKTSLAPPPSGSSSARISPTRGRGNAVPNASTWTSALPGATTQPRALYGGSRSNSSSSSSSSTSSSSSEPQHRRGIAITRSASAAPAPAPPAAPRHPIDFSKSHLQLMAPVQPSRHGTRRGTTESLNPPSAKGLAPAPAPAEAAENDDYYFLSPNSHAVAASIELARTKESRTVDAQTRRQRERAKAERLQAAYGVHRNDLRYQSAAARGGGVGSTAKGPSSSDSRKRHHRTAAEEFSTELEAAEKEFADPRRRRMMEEGMVRRWAADMLPVLRRRRYIEGDTATTEADMWAEATSQARRMVREKLDAKGDVLRRRREQLVRAQAQREAAALAKLARIIAQHREREQQPHHGHA